jgi:hypothetical protein
MPFFTSVTLFFRQRLQTEQTAAGEAPLVVMRVAVRQAKATVLGLLGFEILAAALDGVIETANLRLECFAASSA